MAPETPTALERAGPRVVRAAAVERSDSSREVRLPGVTRAARRATLAFTVPARVAVRPVEVGDRVTAGQLLARQDSDEYRLAERSSTAALAELEVRLAQAERDQARVVQLAAARAATTEELERARAATEAIRAAYDAASARLDDTHRRVQETTLTAPFAGTVTAVHLEPGEWAAAGAAVIDLTGAGAVEVRVDAPESIRAAIELGSRIEIELPMIGRVVAGRVAAVANAAGGAGGLFPVVIELEADPGVVAGLAAEVVLALKERSELTVPLGAVLDSGSSRPSVFRITDGRASRVPIEPGRLLGDRLTLRSADLLEGDLVVVVGQTALVDGDPVEVR